MTFTRSTDYPLIQSILTNAQCYRRMRNDDAPELEAFRVEPKAGIEYIVAYDRDSPLAVFLLVTKANDVEVHICFLPEAWGVTVHITECFLSWVWENTEIPRLVAPVPSYNRLALRVAEMTGFRKTDTQMDVGTRRGKNFDLIMLENRRAFSPIKPAARRKSIHSTS